MDYQSGNRLRRGDIALMCFRPEFASDLDAFSTAQLGAGLTVVSLERFIAPSAQAAASSSNPQPC